MVRRVLNGLIGLASWPTSESPRHRHGPTPEEKEK